MDWIIYFLIGLALGYWLGLKRGLNGAGADKSRRDKVLALFGSKAEITNDDVQKALCVSDATATRVLDEMEKSGYLIQIGDTGSGVTYHRK